MKSSYKVIVFDLGNTLIRFDHNIAANKISSRFNIDPKKIYDMFFDSELTRAFEKGDITPREFYERAIKLLGIEITYDEFVPIWNDIFWADEEVCALARALKKKYKLFLLSNVNALHFDYIKNKFAIIDIFDEIILSYVVRATKPDRIIFETVIERSGELKDKLLYIDDREDLIKEAVSLGIDSVRFENASKLKETMRSKGVIF